MYKATFELKAITPVFMRGADKKGQRLGQPPSRGFCAGGSGLLLGATMAAITMA